MNLYDALRKLFVKQNAVQPMSVRCRLGVERLEDRMMLDAKLFQPLSGTTFSGVGR